MSFKPHWFGDYELLRLLGVGGMAEVYLARTTGAQGFEKVAVVKRMLAKLTKDARFVKMFIDEAKMTVQLQHANIVQILSLDEQEGLPFIVMEYVHGRDLYGVLRHAARSKASIPVDFGLHCIVEMLKGLGYAHTATGTDGQPLNLVHRDVTPSNIFVSYEGEVKLGDFGVAHGVGAVDAREVRGKFSYLAPEALKGLELDARADLFSAGVVLWETLAGRRLFLGRDDTEVLKQVRDRDPEPPSLLNPKVPPDLDRLTAKALAKDPAQRFQSALEFEEALGDYLFARRLRWNRRRLSDVMQAHFPEDSKPLVLPPATPRDGSVARGDEGGGGQDPIDIEEDVDLDSFSDETDRIVVALANKELTPVHPPGSRVESKVSWPESLESQIVAVDDIDAMVMSQAAQRVQSEQLLVHWNEGGMAPQNVGELVRTLTYEPQTVLGVGVMGEWKVELPELSKHLMWDTLGGFSDPDLAPKVASSFDRVSLTRLLYELTLRRLTGLVSISAEDGRQRRQIFLEDGYPSYVYSNDPRDGAPALLVEHKLLTPATIYRGLVQVIGDRMPIDQALVSVAGADSQAHVERMFSAMVRSRLYDAFGWGRGSFRVYQGVESNVRLSFRVPPLLGIFTRAIRRSHSLENLQAHLQLQGHTAVLITQGREEHIASLHLREDEQQVVDVIDGQRNIPRILETVGATTPEKMQLALAVIYVLAETQIAKLV